jgi:hypothetical protein
MIFWIYLIAQVTVTMSTTKQEISIGESFKVEIKVSGNFKKIREPYFHTQEFHTISTSRIESIQHIGSKFMREITFSYTLLPRAIGKFTIPGCKVVCDGKEYQTNSLTIKVVKNKSLPSPQKKEKHSPLSPHSLKDLFVRAFVSKRKVYVNEQIILTLQIYQGISLLSSPQISEPKFTGFWKEEIGDYKEYKLINGRKYFVFTKKYALFPTNEGIYKIEPFLVRCEIDDFFSFPFSFSFGSREKILKTSPLKIVVKPLPPPADVSVVGTFRCTQKLSSNTVEQFKPVTLTVVVSGKGNVREIEVGELELGEDFKVYKGEEKVKTIPTKEGVKGEKIISYIIVPKREGRFKFEGIEFKYFDPKEERYVTISKPEFELIVTAGKEKSESFLVTRGEEEKKVRKIGEDIKYIKTHIITLKNEGNYIYRAKFFPFFLVFPLLVLLFSMLYSFHKERISNNPQLKAYIEASKIKKIGLERCKELAKKGDKTFFEESHKTLIKVIEGKLNIKMGSISLETIGEKLRAKRVPEEVIQEVKRFFSLCESVRFGGKEYSNLLEFYHQLYILLKKLTLKF